MRDLHHPLVEGPDLPHTRGEARSGLPEASSWGTGRRVVIVGSGDNMGVRAWGWGSVAWRDEELRRLVEEGTCPGVVACIAAVAFVALAMQRT